MTTENENAAPELKPASPLPWETGGTAPAAPKVRGLLKIEGDPVEAKPEVKPEAAPAAASEGAPAAPAEVPVAPGAEAPPAAPTGEVPAAPSAEGEQPRQKRKYTRRKPLAERKKPGPKPKKVKAAKAAPATKATVKRVKVGKKEAAERNSVVTYVDDATSKNIEAAAKAAGMKVARWVREVLVGQFA